MRNIEVVQLLNREPQLPMQKGNNAERQLSASTDFIALILNVLRIKERLQNDYICTLKM